MDIIDDEIVSMYIEESRTHLGDIESDLLTIEAQGATIDRELVNKVFRAAHSIKGGAGFLNLTVIKELSHKIENVLDMIRNNELVPTPEIISLLLVSFDRLREMINNIQESDRCDIAGLVQSLTQLTNPMIVIDEPVEAVAADTVTISLPGGISSMEIPRFDLEQAVKGGKKVFLIQFDLIHDVHQLWRTPLDLIRNLDQHGTMLESMVSLLDMGTLDDEPVNRIPFYVLLATGSGSDELATAFSIDPVQITGISPSGILEEKAPAKKTTPKKGKEKAASVTVPEQEQITSPPPAPTVTPKPAPPIEEVQVRQPERAPAIPDFQPALQENLPPASAGIQPESTLRINVSLLDTLMNLAGELVLSRNQLLQAIQRSDQSALKAAGHRINSVTTELQESIMLTRMQPIGNIFNKFTRVVRDLSRDLGKDINLNITGKEVELDKTIIEGLSDPLTHLIRNSVDHGIESPEERRRSRKPAKGSVTLNAYHEAGQVIIEISDDGKGLDPEKIARVALAKGLITPDQMKTMTDKEKRFLIMAPGFSTAEQVTEVSGRGVGMDVVKTNIEKLNGQVDIESDVGRGSVFKIKLPLTLAIIPCLFVESGGEQFAIPQISVVETIRIGAAQVSERIVRMGEADLLLLRGEIIPILHLADSLAIPLTFRDPATGMEVSDRRARVSDRRSLLTAQEDQSDIEGNATSNDSRRGGDRRYRAESDVNLVIVSTGIMQYGMVVQKLHDSEEIVVKALGRHLKHLKCYAGATIMGDGRVALILDASGLAQSEGILTVAGAAKAELLAKDVIRETQGEMQALLTFKYGEMQQLAVPLELVARVEKIDSSDVEIVGGRRVMQYRGEVLPLVTVSDVANVTELDYNAGLVVIVFEVAGREVGMVANTPVDSIENRFAIDSATLRQTGILGSVIVQKKTLMIVDIFELVETLHPEWFVERREARVATSSGSTILLAEDSDFFRMQVKKFMEDEGYRVITGEDGLAAWDALEENAGEVNLVVTDIEMPRMNGYELSRRIRSDSRFCELPVIALTSLASDEDMEKGKEVGLTDYLIKLDREKLLEAISRYCRQSG